MVTLAKCIDDAWWVVNDEVGKESKRRDEWGGRILEEGELTVFPGGNEGALSAPEGLAGHIYILEKSCGK